MMLPVVPSVFVTVPVPAMLGPSAVVPAPFRIPMAVVPISIATVGVGARNHHSKQGGRRNDRLQEFHGRSPRFGSGSRGYDSMAAG
jgi:hypothetical protein